MSCVVTVRYQVVQRGTVLVSQESTHPTPIRPQIFPSFLPFPSFSLTLLIYLTITRLTIEAFPVKINHSHLWTSHLPSHLYPTEASIISYQDVEVASHLVFVLLVDAVTGESSQAGAYRCFLCLLACLLFFFSQRLRCPRIPPTLSFLGLSQRRRP